MSSPVPTGAVLASRRPRWLSAVEGVEHPVAVMVLWGVAMGLLTAILLLAVSPGEWPVMGSRVTGLRDSMTVLKQGGPLLLGRHGATGALYPVGVGDDEGIYVYLPLLSRLLGVADPVAMLRYAYVALFGVAAAGYPVMFYKLTRSLLAGLAAPVMLVVCVRFMGFNDIYWIPAWGMFVLLPMIFLLARDWSRYGFVGLLAIALAAGWLSSIRNSSGLGIVIAAAAILLLRRWRWWRLLPAIALLALVYFSTNVLVLSQIRAHRDQTIGDTALSRNQPTMHSLWHTAYIGLGYLPNNYGIYYNDSVAQARVQREAPGTVYLSNRYATVLRKAYFKLWREHPGEVLEQYAAKAIVTTAETSPYLLLVLLTMPAMLLLGPKRRIHRLWLSLTVPAVLVGFLPTMVAIPTQGYEEGLYGVLGVLGILGLCCMLEQLEIATRARGSLLAALGGLRGSWSAAIGWRDPLKRSARACGVALIALALLVIAGHFISRSAERWGHVPSGALIDAAPSQHSGSATYPRV
jgi:hypothetical protein